MRERGESVLLGLRDPLERPRTKSIAIAFAATKRRKDEGSAMLDDAVVELGEEVVVVGVLVEEVVAASPVVEELVVRTVELADEATDELETGDPLPAATTDTTKEPPSSGM